MEVCRLTILGFMVLTSIIAFYEKGKGINSLNEK